MQGQGFIYILHHQQPQMSWGVKALCKRENTRIHILDFRVLFGSISLFLLKLSTHPSSFTQHYYTNTEVQYFAPCQFRSWKCLDIHSRHTEERCSYHSISQDMNPCNNILCFTLSLLKKMYNAYIIDLFIPSTFLSLSLSLSRSTFNILMHLTSLPLGRLSIGWNMITIFTSCGAPRVSPMSPTAIVMCVPIGGWHVAHPSLPCSGVHVPSICVRFL